MPDSFSYTQFRIGDDSRTVSFDYTLTHDGQAHQLTETLIFPVALQDSAAQRASLRALHLVIGISYYKIFTPATMTYPYQMDADEADFWNNIWRNGLGEFMYVNKLSPDSLAQFSAQDGTAFPADAHQTQQTKTALLGIGLGKDSILAGEALKQLDVPVTAYMMTSGEESKQAQVVADVMQVPLHIVTRSIDKQLLALQELPGAHKGHVPISLVYGLIGVALAVATDNSYVVVGNEASASIPRHQADFGAVNHQWSKSFGSEERLQQFIHRSVSPEVTYFSAVRQLTSIAIAKLFARYPQYFEVFTSDNAVFRLDPAKRPNARWSLDSPKTLSSFILLAPWLSVDDLLRTFAKNFLNEPSQESLFWRLLGVEGTPPLDCVGTTDELVLSLNLAYQQGKFVDSCLVQAALKRSVIQDKDWTAQLQKDLLLQPEQALPKELTESFHALFTSELAA